MARIGLGIGIQYNKVLGGLSAEALEWEARIIANGGTIPAATLAIFDQYFFIPAKANGNILSELDRLNIYCGLVGYEIAARTNLIKSAHYVTPVSSPTFNAAGYKSSGTSYLNLNYNIGTQGVKYTQNSACYGYVVASPAFAGSFRPMGSFGGGSRNDCERDTNGSIGSINTGSAVRNTLEPSGNVHFYFNRENGINMNAITNGNSVNGAAVSSAIANEIVFELCLNLGGTPTAPFDTESHMASFHGSSSVNLNIMRSLLDNLFTALGV